MKKKKIIIIVSIIVILIAAGFTVYKLTTKTNDNKAVKVEKDKKETGYTFKSQDGEKITIKADKLVTATGSAGASNYKYYLKGTTLYFRDISSSKNEEVILAYNVKDIYIDGDEVIAELKDNGKVVKENSYITYKNRKNEEQTSTNQIGEEITINADKIVTATGFAGASNYKYYLRGTTLYFRNISSSKNEEEILAYNVKDIYLDGDMVVAELQANGNVVKENSYITYKKQNEYREVYKLTTQDSKEIIINADKLVIARGFAGANNHVFYLKGQTLYYRNISTENNNEELLAYNINDIFIEGDMVVATKQSNSKIIAENNYITYR